MGQGYDELVTLEGSVVTARPALGRIFLRCATLQTHDEEGAATVLENPAFGVTVTELAGIA